jgi:2,3-bisphosphoglycerate-dependent phosphoglycerate mutase
VPDLAAGRTVLLTSHSNALRALVKHLEVVSDDDIASVNIPTGIPLVYAIDRHGEAIGPGRYLDPAAAVAGAAAVAHEGLGGRVSSPVPRCP